MQRTNIYLAEEQLAALDELAAARGTSRAKVVRNLIDRGLSGSSSDLARDIAALEHSFGALTDEELDELPRDGGARSRHLEAVWRR